MLKNVPAEKGDMNELRDRGHKKKGRILLDWIINIIGRSDSTQVGQGKEMNDDERDTIEKDRESVYHVPILDISLRLLFIIYDHHRIL